MTAAAVAFAVFGYGKLGGIELGYGSDLDLVFVYDAARGGATDGERSVDNAVFYTRLGQRMIHIMETHMAMGQLYEVDMRLRPSGESGMLVSTVQGFPQLPAGHRLDLGAPGTGAGALCRGRPGGGGGGE